MCVVIDTNAFHRVFDSTTVGSAEFSPVKDWLYTVPKAKLVYGGTDYRKELSNQKKYFGILTELRRSSKIAEIDDTVVDRHTSRIRKLVPKKAFDDPHIVAIFAASGCRVFCSLDSRADKYIKMKHLYPKGQVIPGIYRSRKHVNLLRSGNLVKLRNQVR